MTTTNKDKIIDNILELLIQLTGSDAVPISENPNEPKTEKTPDCTELLTIRECTEKFKGLKEYTVRKLIAENKISYFRNGTGRGSKILIPKKALLDFLNSG